MTNALPPHFPDPSANPVAILEARIVELEEINAAQFAELTGWRTQLEAALVRLAEMEAALENAVDVGGFLETINILELKLQAEQAANREMYGRMINSLSPRTLKKLKIALPMRVPPWVFSGKEAP